jgi:large subunit ribosomal protein L35
MPPQQALAIARQKGLDLVEIAPTASRRSAGSWTSASTSTRSRSARGRQEAPEGHRGQGDQVPAEGGRARLPVQEEAHRALPGRRRQGEGDDLLPRARDGAPRDRAAHPRAADRGAGRRGHRRDDAAAGRQPDAHHPGAEERVAPGGWHGRRPKPRRPVDASARRPSLPVTQPNAGAPAVPAPTRSHAETEDPSGRRQALQEDRHGKFLRSKAFKRHILTSKSRKRKRGLRGTTVVSDAGSAKLRRMLPYK